MPSVSLGARAVVAGLPLALAGAAATFAGCSGATFTPAVDGGSSIVDAAAVDAAIDAPAAAPDAGRDARPPVVIDCTDDDDGPNGAPTHLACTGLYSDFATLTVAPSAQPFEPGLRLWSDGAEKHRWIALPPGAKIDTTDMNEWRFPVGTKLWKEFKLSQRRIETRMFWKRGDGDWVRGTYRWNDDESDATFLAGGEPNVGGTTYGVPTLQQCDTCHAGRIDKVLGFEAVSLSQPSASGLAMPALVAQQLLTKNPTSPLAIPDDGTGRAAPALGWLHMNCGTSCHNDGPSSFAGATDLWMRLEIGADGTLGAYTATNTYKTAVNVTPFLEPYASGGWKRIKPNDPFGGDAGDGVSLIPFRDANRSDPGLQMPPIATHIADLEHVAALRDWIQHGNFPPGSYPQ